jgi:LPXTG-motif cell wall-anchored protein
VSLNQGPGLDTGHVRQIALNDILFVIDGPQRADDLWWWRLRTREGVEGWGLNDHLSPFSGECFGSAAPAPVAGASTVLPGQSGTPATRAAASQGQELPATGSNPSWLFFAGVLVLVLVVAGLVRRRAQNMS